MTLLKKLPLLFLAFLIAVSCEEETVIKKGSVEFSVSATDPSSGGRTKGNISSLLVTIEDADGNIIHERKNIPLYAFGEEFLSEPIALTVGPYRLTEFIVLDENNVAIYATPAEGSPMAYLVDDPLPVDFSITKDNSTKVTPQVIKIEGFSAADFGYATFALDIVNTFTFASGIFAYNSVSGNFELTTAHMMITANGETKFDMDLSAITNTIRIEDGFENYTITVTKEGYGSYERSFSAGALLEFGSGAPLVITLLAQSLSDGLIAYYPFNGTADDASGNEFHGIVHEAVLTTDRNGMADAAYSFDGLNDYIQVLHDEALNLAGDFTISLWTEVSSAQEPENGINDILRKWTGNAEGYPFAISYLNPLADDANEDKILFARYDGQVCSNVLETHSPTITNDTFIHVALIKDGSNLRTYLNDQLVSEIADPATCTTANTADMTIGCRGNLVRFFKGKIDDIRIYNRALTEAEIGQLAGE